MLFISVDVVSPDYTVVTYQMPTLSRIWEIKKLYCELKNLDVSQVILYFSRSVLDLNSTFDHAGVKDGDAIYALFCY